MQTTEIIPAILAKDVEDLKKKLSEIPVDVKLVHIDVLEKDIWTKIDRDFGVHIMEVNTQEEALLWAERGAKRIAVHKLDEVILRLRDKVELGLAVELDVPLDEVYPLLDQVDFVQLMSIAQIGAQGRPFEPEIFDRIKEVREKFPDITISVDGGIDKSNYQELIKAGANRLVVGSHFEEVWSRTKSL